MSITPTSRWMTFFFAVISSLLWLYSSVLAGADLNNQTKQFVPNSDVSFADWASSEELHRTWQAALVRIPKHHKVYAGRITRGNPLSEANDLASFRLETV